MFYRFDEKLKTKTKTIIMSDWNFITIETKFNESNVRRLLHQQQPFYLMLAHTRLLSDLISEDGKSMLVTELSEKQSSLIHALELELSNKEELKHLSIIHNQNSRLMLYIGASEHANASEHASANFIKSGKDATIAIRPMLWTSSVCYGLLFELVEIII